MMTDEERRGEQRRNKGAESIPQWHTCSPGVVLLLHFHMRQHFDKTVQGQLDTDWPTYKNHYHLSKHCYSEWGRVLIKSCKANELRSLIHWLHQSAMNDSSECPVEDHLNKMAGMSMWAVHVILIRSPGAHNKLSISSVQCVCPCGSLMGPRWATSGSMRAVILILVHRPLPLSIY